LALEDQFVEDGNVCKEYNEDDHFVGKKRDRLASIFQISHNHYEGNFIVVWLANGNGQPLQIARAKSDPNCNPEKPNCVMIQYFQPTSRSQHVQELYTGWDSEGGLH
jgi:hypothetical protein